MEAWKIALLDGISDMKKYGRNEVLVSTPSEAAKVIVREAILQGIDEYPLSSDFKELRSFNETTLAIVVGSWQAQNEFISRVDNVRAEVLAWRQYEDKEKELEETKQELETLKKNEEKGFDIESLILVICLIGALLIFLKD